MAQLFLVLMLKKQVDLRVKDGAKLVNGKT